MSLNGVLVTPIEQNRSLLNSVFKFKPSSKLYYFVRSKGGVNKTLFTLAEILTILKDAIRGEGLYDEKNPSIIMCSGDLEAALDMKALHVTEIRDLVLKHLVKIDNDAFLARYCREHGQPNPNNVSNNPIPVSAAAQRLIHTANISTNVVLDKKAKFTCKPKFLLVLRTMPDVDKNKTVFTYEEVTLLLSTYILRNKQRFFDTRNIKLAMVKGDLLGDAFGVNAFHRCQVNNLLRGQLIPYNPDNPPDRAVVTSYGSPGCGVTIREMPVPVTSIKGEAATPENLAGSAAGLPLPAFPALNKAQTLPAGSNFHTGVVRKRSDSDCEAEDVKPKLARSEDGTVIVKTSPSDCETETETIYSAQSRETNEVKSEVESEDDSEEDKESDYDIAEYEPETCNEAERPPQAGGRRVGSGSVSFSDSDSDVNDNFRSVDNTRVREEGEKLKKESVYWGDNSEDEKILDSHDSELEAADIWHCVECKKPTKPHFRYCGACWNIRKGWVGSYDRKRKRKIANVITSHNSDTETDGTGETQVDRPRMDSQDSGIGSGESQELEIAVVNNIKPVLNRSVSLKSSDSLSVTSSMSSASSMDSGYQSTSTAASHLCLLCCSRPKNASLVHGRIGHQVCCYQCAKKLWRKRSDCPVCRRKVERIIKIIPA